MHANVATVESTYVSIVHSVGMILYLLLYSTKVSAHTYTYTLP